MRRGIALHRPRALLTALGLALAGAVILSAALVRPWLLLAILLGSLAGLLGAAVLAVHRRGWPAIRTAQTAVVNSWKAPPPPPGTYRAHPPRHSRRPLAIGLRLFVVAVGAVAALHSRDAAPVRVSALQAGIPVHYEATFDSRRDDGRRWRVRESVSIARSRLRRLLPRRGGANTLARALAGRWRYRRPKRRAAAVTYVRAGTRDAGAAVLPVINAIAVRLPALRLQRSSAILVPRPGSVVAFVGPRRLIYGTQPAATTRQATPDVEITRVRIGDMQTDRSARVVRLEVANRLGRSALYRAAWDAAFKPVAFWLLAVAAVIVVGGALARPLFPLHRPS